MVDAKTRWLVLRRTYNLVQKGIDVCWNYHGYLSWEYDEIYDAITDCKACSDSQVNYCPVIPGFNDKVIKNCRRCAAVMNVPYYYDSETGEICLK